MRKKTLKLVTDNTRRPFNPSPAAVKLARHFDRYASVDAEQTMSDVILSVQMPKTMGKSEALYDVFFHEAGHNTSATIYEDRVEIKMSKAQYEQRFTLPA